MMIYVLKLKTREMIHLNACLLRFGGFTLIATFFSVSENQLNLMQFAHVSMTLIVIRIFDTKNLTF
jgi:hypothetical protein